LRWIRAATFVWNKGAERLYGYSTEEAHGKNVAELLYPQRPLFDEALRTTLECGEWNGELEQVSKNKRCIISQSRWTLVDGWEVAPDT
jgi:two-component system, cell cycle sensor histidine kinase and response regulator CckA